MLSDKTIGFLGAGSIAEALIRGLIMAGTVKPDQVIVTNRANRERLQSLHERFGVRVDNRKEELVRQSDVLVVACKPQDVLTMLREIKPDTRPGQILLSLAAGVPTTAIAAGVAPGTQVVRAMPNTSCQVSQSATAFCLGEGAHQEARMVCHAILGAVGRVVEVSETQMDAVTGLSGSGPAYVYYLIEAMLEAGKSVGLADDVARELVLQTFMGAAKTLVETGEDPAVLRQKVTSPNGTTQAGLTVLQEAGFTETMVRAIGRATQRSRELGVLAVAPRAAAN